MNYEEDLKIDDNALDLEWEDQAALAIKYGRHYAECRRRNTLAEERIKVVRAELIAEANEDPEGCCKKEKPNAADIEAYYRNHPRHKKAKEEWIQTQYDLDLAEIAKNEICFTRKAALENLVILHGQSYFAGPKVPRDLNKERIARNDKSDDAVSIKMTRTKYGDNS